MFSLPEKVNIEVGKAAEWQDFTHLVGIGFRFEIFFKVGKK